MLISNESKQRELIPAGNHIARCFQVIEIGTVREEFAGEPKFLKKVRIGWEVLDELRVFNKEIGQQPMMISREYTASMYEKATLHQHLVSWRGKQFSAEELKGFEVEDMIGTACLLNIIIVQGKADPSRMYNSISSVSALPKGTILPPVTNYNDHIKLSYSKWNEDVFLELPEFLQNKMKLSAEYPGRNTAPAAAEEVGDKLPF